MDQAKKSEELNRLRMLASEARDMCRLRDKAIFELSAAGVRAEEILDACGLDWAAINRIRREQISAVLPPEGN